MSGLKKESTRNRRYQREKKYSETFDSMTRDVKVALRQDRREATKSMNEAVTKTIRDLLVHTNPDCAEKLCKGLEKDVYKKYPTPANRIRMAIDYISASGIDVSTPLWELQLGMLKSRIEIETNPNNFYLGGY